MIVRFYLMGKEVWSILTMYGVHNATFQAMVHGIRWDDYRVTEI